MSDHSEMEDEQYRREMELVGQSQEMMRLEEEFGDGPDLGTLSRRVRLYLVATAKGMVRRRAENRHIRRRLDHIESVVDSLDELVGYAHDRIDEARDADVREDQDVSEDAPEVDGIPVSLVASKGSNGLVDVDEVYNTGGIWSEAWLVLAAHASEAVREERERANRLVRALREVDHHLADDESRGPRSDVMLARDVIRSAIRDNDNHNNGG